MEKIEENVVYIRNEGLNADYEVILEERAYSDSEYAAGNCLEDNEDKNVLNQYFFWLTELVCDERHPKVLSAFIKTLHETEFIWL